MDYDYGITLDDHERPSAMSMPPSIIWQLRREKHRQLEDRHAEHRAHHVARRAPRSMDFSASHVFQPAEDPGRDGNRGGDGAEFAAPHQRRKMPERRIADQAAQPLRAGD